MTTEAEDARIQELTEENRSLYEQIRDIAIANTELGERFVDMMLERDEAKEQVAVLREKLSVWADLYNLPRVT